jgi:Alpha-glutamyl/putrescinyl thymine pyrophosphorylase clade 3
VWPTRQHTARRLEADLATFSANQRGLPGIADPAARATLAMQMVASLRRLDYSDIIRTRDISSDRADPNSPSFDPEKAAVYQMRSGHIDEAFWLVFLITHLGRNLTHGWQRLREVYSGLGGQTWTWARVSANPAAFRAWLLAHQGQIGGGFGGHWKRESIRADVPDGTATVVESYVAWVGPAHSHGGLMANLTQAGGNSPESIFDHAYHSMNVTRFGRLGRFDYLCLLGRLGFAQVRPGRAYLKGATGPLDGARLLFGGATNAALGSALLENWILELDAVLGVGMQVMEDSLCNWQKSPIRFKHFRG